MLRDHGENFDKDIRALVSLADKLSDASAETAENRSDSKNYLTLREDSAKKCIDKQVLLDISPAVKDEYIFVPKLMETE